METLSFPAIDRAWRSLLAFSHFASTIRGVWPKSSLIGGLLRMPAAKALAAHRRIEGEVRGADRTTRRRRLDDAGSAACLTTSPRRGRRAT